MRTTRFAFELLALAGTIAPALALVVPAATERAARVRVSHILVDSEEMAETAISTIKAGTPFAQVAETLSACNSREQGGDLGWIAPGAPNIFRTMMIFVLPVVVRICSTNTTRPHQCSPFFTIIWGISFALARVHPLQA